MKKGISFYFGYNYDPLERAKMIHDAGFDCVITNSDKKFWFQNDKIQKQIENFKNHNISVSSLHMRYNSEDLPFFWKKGLKGKYLEHKLIKDVKTAHKYGFMAVVVHLVGEPNEIGLNRLKRVLKVCDKLNIDLAIENIHKNECFFYVFDMLKHPRLKFCYDSGHGNVWNKEVDFLTKYGDKLVCLHLHDNNGEEDQHTLNKYGTIKWREIAKKLAKLPQEIALDYEMLMYKREKETPKEVLDTVYKQACELEKMILEEKEKLQKKEAK